VHSRHDDGSAGDANYGRIRSRERRTFGKLASINSTESAFVGTGKMHTTSRSAIFTREYGAMNSENEYIRIDASHPGTLLLEEFLKPLGITPHALAMALHVPASRIDAIVKGKRSITGETAMRLGRYFGTSARFWLNLQAYYDLAVAEDQQTAIIECEVQPRIAIGT
jgi:antitoxin HigA-1